MTARCGCFVCVFLFLDGQRSGCWLTAGGLWDLSIPQHLADVVVEAPLLMSRDEDLRREGIWTLRAEDRGLGRSRDHLFQGFVVKAASRYGL